MSSMVGDSVFTVNKWFDVGVGIPIHIIWGFINDPLNILLHGEMDLSGSIEIYLHAKIVMHFPTHNC